jgi:hypothetical protein
VAPTTPIRAIPPRELPRGAPLGVAVVAAPAVHSDDARPLVTLPLWIVLGISLVVLGIALTGPRVLPEPVGIVVFEHRESLLYAGTATLLGIGLGILIGLVGS